MGVPFGNDLGLLSNRTGVTDEEAKQSGRSLETLIADLPNEVRVRGHPATGWVAGRSPPLFTAAFAQRAAGDSPAPKLARKDAKMQGFDKVCQQ